MNKFEIPGKITEEQKISEIAKLVSGLAHHINDPMAFIKSNLSAITQYTDIIFKGAERLAKIADLSDTDDLNKNQDLKETLQWLKQAKIESVFNDIQPLISETQDGINRISAVLQRLLIIDQVVRYAGFELADVNKLIKAIGHSAKVILPSRVSLTTVLCNYPLMIYGKIDQLRISIENVLHNAMDAVGEEGEIKLTTNLDGSWVCLEIHDSGDGIPPGAISCVFEPFYSTKESVNRIGLELTISQYIVQAHGGYMKIKSDAESGTCVLIWLPLHDVR